MNQTLPQLIKDLKFAREKLEQGWTQGFFARRPDTSPCYPKDSDAACWCIAGAVRLASAQETKQVFDEEQRYLRVLDLLTQDLPEDFKPDKGGIHPVAQYNDYPGRTKEDVLALIDRTIVRVQQLIKQHDAAGN